MATPRWKYLAVDGVTTHYVIDPGGYEAGSTALSINIQQQRDSWTETNPLTGEIDLAEPLQLGDTGIIFYLDRSPDFDRVVIVHGLIAQVDTVGEINAFINTQTSHTGQIDEPASIHGHIPSGLLFGEIDVTGIEAFIHSEEH